MKSTDTLIRRNDGKEFKVKFHSHWSDIVSADGEEDCVKWYGDGYVSNNKGFSYTVKGEK